MNDAKLKTRLIDLIIDHWEDVKKKRRYPKQSDLDIEMLEHWLDYCILVDISKIKDGIINYNFVGKQISDVCLSKHALPHDRNVKSPLVKHSIIEKVLDHKTPVKDEGVFLNYQHKTVKYRQCFVPLSSNNRDITSIFGGARLKIYNKLKL